jgi:hypothetical protein
LDWGNDPACSNANNADTAQARGRPVAVSAQLLTPYDACRFGPALSAQLLP